MKSLDKLEIIICSHPFLSHSVWKRKGVTICNKERKTALFSLISGALTFTFETLLLFTAVHLTYND